MRFLSQIAVLVALLSGCEKSLCPDLQEPVVASTAPVSAPTYVGFGDPYLPGNLPVRRMELEPCTAGSPLPMLIFAPQTPGSYPVVIFQHGFLARNGQYTHVLTHLASHGFVVVAPQMYEPSLAALLGQPSAADEARAAAELLTWLPVGLPAVLDYPADVTRVGLAGHSRGGQVAWLVLRENPGLALAIAGLDPVDGGGPLNNQERAVQGTFSFSLPALVIGAGLGGTCAPEGRNHEVFYEASRSPAWHVIAVNQGHGDMQDDAAATTAALLCSSGPDREGMRRLTAGMLVALFRGSLQGDTTAYVYLSDPARSPLEVEIESR